MALPASGGKIAGFILSRPIHRGHPRGGFSIVPRPLFFNPRPLDGGGLGWG